MKTGHQIFSLIQKANFLDLVVQHGKKNKILQNILIKENAYVAKIRITFYLKHFFRKTVL